MSGLRAHAAAAAAIVERDARLFMSYRLRPFGLLIGPVTTVALFYYVSRLVDAKELGASDGYFAYVVIGIVALDVLTAALGGTPATLRQELVAGTFERQVVSGFGALAAVVAMMAFPLLLGLVVAVVTVVFAAAAFGMPVAWPEVLLAPPAALLGALAFAPFGILAVAAMLAVKQTLAGISIVLTGLSLFAGVYFPVRLLPEWTHWVADVQPLTPALDLLRTLMSTAPDTGSAWADAAKLVGFAAVLLPLSLWVLGRALLFGRRRGTITEY
jgi:ABC-2 type transport system permease protein